MKRYPWQRSTTTSASKKNQDAATNAPKASWYIHRNKFDTSYINTLDCSQCHAHSNASVLRTTSTSDGLNDLHSASVGNCAAHATASGPFRCRVTEPGCSRFVFAWRLAAHGVEAAFLDVRS